MKAIEPIYDAIITDGLGGRPFDTMAKALAFAPKALKLGAYRTVYRFVTQYFKDPRIRTAFSFHPLFIGGNPFRSPSIYLMIPYLEEAQGVWYAHGGMQALVDALAKKFTGMGGVLRPWHHRPVDRSRTWKRPRGHHRRLRRYSL